MRKKLTIFGLCAALVLGMILVSLGDIPLILPIDLYLNTLLDVNLGSPTDKDALIWDATTAKWIPEARSTMPNSIDLNDLGDVNAGAPNDNDALTWDAGTSKWIPEEIAAGVSEEDLAYLDNFDDASRHWGWFDDAKNGTITEAGELLTISIANTVNGRIGDQNENTGPRCVIGDPGAPFEVKVKLNSYTVNDYTHAGIFISVNVDMGQSNSWYFFGRCKNSAAPVDGLVSWANGIVTSNAVTTLPIYLRFRLAVLNIDPSCGNVEVAYSTDDISYTVFETWSLSNLLIYPAYQFHENMVIGIFVRNGVQIFSFNEIAAPFEWFKMCRTLGPG